MMPQEQQLNNEQQDGNVRLVNSDASPSSSSLAPFVLISSSGSTCCSSSTGSTGDTTNPNSNNDPLINDDDDETHSFASGQPHDVITSTSSCPCCDTSAVTFSSSPKACTPKSIARNLSNTDVMAPKSIMNDKLSDLVVSVSMETNNLDDIVPSLPAADEPNNGQQFHTVTNTSSASTKSAVPVVTSKSTIEDEKNDDDLAYASSGTIKGANATIPGDEEVKAEPNEGATTTTTAESELDQNQNQMQQTSTGREEVDRRVTRSSIANNKNATNASRSRPQRSRASNNVRSSSSSVAASSSTAPTTSTLPVPKWHTTNTGNGHPCVIHTPTFSELESLNSFGTYVREVVLPAANIYEIDKNHPDYTPDLYMKTKIQLCEGMALIRLPKGFGCSRAAPDRTGRGPIWQSGTELGDWIIESPIEQHVLGMAGVYEFTFVDRKPVTMSEFRDRADSYKENQIGQCIKRNQLKKHEERKEKQQATISNEQQPRKNQLDIATEEENANIRQERENNTTNEEEKQRQLEGKVDDDHDNKNHSEQQLDGADEQENVEFLERLFWKRLGPTMVPAWYGADQEDSLFYADEEIDHADPLKCNPAASWSLSKLDSCLQVLPPIPGVTSPYLYVGMWGASFCAHSEDMNLLSINYLHAGAPKIWYSVAEPDAARFESLAQHHFARVASNCKEFLRHKRYLLSPAVLAKAGIRYQTAIQYPGDAVITMPGGYHWGFNTGFNVAEATNFGVPEWIPFGHEAKVCLCRPDSVRIDMYKLSVLIQQFQKDQKRNRRLSFAEWRRKRDWGKKIHGGTTAQSMDEKPTSRKRMNTGAYSSSSSNDKKQKLSEQQRKNEFWVEVMKPVSSSSSADASKRGLKKKKPKSKSGGTKINQQSKKSTKTISNGEVWHLAKPINKTSNRIFLNARVLCIIPATQNLQLNTNAINVNDSEEEDVNYRERRYDGNDDTLEEQCFAGQVVELSVDNQYVRIHLLGLPRTEDIWMSVYSTRLFLDGGQWNDQTSEELLPSMHYWQEMDSKTRLCA